MKQEVSVGILWNKSCISGAVLGLFSAIFIFTSQLIGGMGSALAVSAISIILWIIKFAGCIWLMHFFMKKLDSGFRLTNRDTFRFGVMTALLSALIYSAVFLANVLFISPENVQQQLDTIMQMYSGMLDSNSMAVLEKMEGNYPRITFFYNVTYCFLYGTILSAILARNIPSRNPFENYEEESDSPR